MLSPKDRIFLKTQQILLGWQSVAEEVAQDRSDMLQLFVAFLSAGLAAVAAVLFDKVSPSPGLAFAALMLVASLLVYHRRRLLRRRLRRSTDVALESIGRLKEEEEE